MLLDNLFITHGHAYAGSQAQPSSRVNGEALLPQPQACTHTSPLTALLLIKAWSVRHYLYPMYKQHMVMCLMKGEAWVTSIFGHALALLLLAHFAGHAQK